VVVGLGCPNNAADESSHGSSAGQVFINEFVPKHPLDVQPSSIEMFTSSASKRPGFRLEVADENEH